MPFLSSSNRNSTRRYHLSHIGLVEISVPDRPRRRRAFQGVLRRLRRLRKLFLGTGLFSVLALALFGAGRGTHGAAAHSNQPAAGSLSYPGSSPVDPPEAGIQLVPRPVDRGDFRLRVLSSRIDRTGPEGSPQLEVELAITNTHPTRKIDTFDFPLYRVQIADNYANSYERMPIPIDEEKALRGTVYPGETVLVRLRFQQPVQLAKHLDLEMAGPDERDRGDTVRFRIPASEIRVYCPLRPQDRAGIVNGSRPQG